MWIGIVCTNMFVYAPVIASIVCTNMFVYAPVIASISPPSTGVGIMPNRAPNFPNIPVNTMKQAPTWITRLEPIWRNKWRTVYTINVFWKSDASLIAACADVTVIRMQSNTFLNECVCVCARAFVLARMCHKSVKHTSAARVIKQLRKYNNNNNNNIIIIIIMLLKWQL